MIAKTIFPRRSFFLRVAAVLLIAMLLVSESVWLQGSLYSKMLPVLGFTLVVLCVLGRIWSSIYIVGHKNEEVIMTGPYSLCRHPLYFFTLLGAAGVGLESGSLLFTVLLLLVFLVCYPFVILNEEEKLRTKFGPTYVEYCRKVPRFWIRPGSYRQPEKLTLNLSVYQRSLRDSFWFLATVPFFAMIDILHDYEVIPVLFSVF